MAPIDSVQARLPQTFSCFVFFLMQNLLSAIKGGMFDHILYCLTSIMAYLLLFSGNPKMQTLKHTPGLSLPSWLHAQPGPRASMGEWGGVGGALSSPRGPGDLSRLLGSSSGCRAGTCPLPLRQTRPPQRKQELGTTNPRISGAAEPRASSQTCRCFPERAGLP